MLTRRKYLIFAWGIPGIIVAQILLGLITAFVLKSRLSTVESKSNFDITSIIDIPKNRITAESETYNKENFIEYDCVIDSIYYITVVKAGKIANTKLENILSFKEKPFPSNNRWFYYNATIASPAPTTTTFFCNRYPYYNVFILPLKETIYKINIHFQGEIIEKEWINSNTLSYSSRDSTVQFSFNDRKKADLGFSQWNRRTLPISSIFFSTDKDSNLYIGCASIGRVSGKRGTPKTLKEIINEDISNKKDGSWSYP